MFGCLYYSLLFYLSMFQKKNSILAISIALPVLAFLFAGALFWMPQVFSKKVAPTHDFVFTATATSITEDSCFGSTVPYVVENGVLEEDKCTKACSACDTYDYYPPEKEVVSGVSPDVSSHDVCAVCDSCKRQKTCDSYTPKLFLHHVSENRNELITLEDAQKLRLDKKAISPDGFWIERVESPWYNTSLNVYSHNGNNYYVWYMRSTADKKDVAFKGREISLDSAPGFSSIDSDNLQFIGWVVR